MEYPDAPMKSVNHIINAFKGKTAGIDSESWLVTFPTHEASDHAKLMITRLQGWSAKLHPTAKNTIKIFCS